MVLSVFIQVRSLFYLSFLWYKSPLLPHTYTYTHSTIHMSTQDGVTADQVAEVQGHHAVCEELRKHIHGDRRPLSKVRFGYV